MTYSKLTNCAQTRSKLRRTLVIVSVEMHQNFHWTAYLNARIVCVCACVDFYEAPHTSNDPKKTEGFRCRAVGEHDDPSPYSTGHGFYKPPRKRQAVTEVDDVYRCSQSHPTHSYEFFMFLYRWTSAWSAQITSPFGVKIDIHCDCYTNVDFSYYEDDNSAVRSGTVLSKRVPR